MTHDVSQNGWPVITPEDMAAGALRYWVIPGKARDITFPLLPGAPGFVLAHWCLYFDREIEDLEASVGDDHGWSHRAIGGTDEWSNHASATAVDLNALKHPQGVRGTFTTTQQYKILDALDRRYRAVIRPGLTFRTTADDMHFELATGLILVRELAATLFYTPRGIVLREANPWLTWTPKAA